jgi:phthalate 4,5-cis-dihydrodiol dehydrogenase
MNGAGNSIDEGRPPKTSNCSAPDPVRLGIVGLGLAGGVMVHATRGHPHVICAGAAEINEELRARFAQSEDVPVCSDVLALVQRDDIDAVYIATPHQFHRDHAILAANNGKHIIVEKPMALCTADCDAMIAAAAANDVQLIVGHTHSFDPAILTMRRLISADRLGRLSMIATYDYTDFLYRPRRPEELDTTRGGGILFNQVPHQVDIIRLLADAPLRSVRAFTNMLDAARPTEGGCMALLEFENGVAASLVYSGYDRFDSDELHHWVSETGYSKPPGHGQTRRALRSFGTAEAERDARVRRMGYGSAISAPPPPHQPHFGVTIVSCEHADLRQSVNGVLLYTDDGVTEVPPEESVGRPGRGDVLEELFQALRHAQEPLHSGAFGRGTVQACLAILRSSRERREMVAREIAEI